MTTRKDYLGLAECLKSAALLARIPTQPESTDGVLAVQRAAEFIASYLGRESSGFDRALFLHNVGVENHEHHRHPTSA
jgi:hypothetical protein